MSPEWQSLCICVNSTNQKQGLAHSPAPKQQHLVLWSGLEFDAVFILCACLQHGLPSHGSAVAAAASVVPAPWGPAQPATASPSRGSSHRVRIPGLSCWHVCSSLIHRAWWPASSSTHITNSNQGSWLLCAASVSPCCMWLGFAHELAEVYPGCVSSAVAAGPGSLHRSHFRSSIIQQGHCVKLRLFCRASRRTASQKGACAARFAANDWWQSSHCTLLMHLALHGLSQLAHLQKKMPAAQG